MPATPISEKDLAELRALFDSVGEGESYLTRRLRNVGRGLLALAQQPTDGKVKT